MFENPLAEKQGADEYLLKTKIINTTGDSREVVWRSQIAFFENVSPAGDKPLAILRKDQMLILKAYETRSLEVRFISQSKSLGPLLRLKPAVRVRRQRVWKY